MPLACSSQGVLMRSGRTGREEGRHMNSIMLAFGGTLLALVPACGVVEEPSTEGKDSPEHPPTDGEQTTAEPTGEAVEEADVSCIDLDDCLRMSERIGEAREASTAGDACVASCVASYALLCHRVRTICAVAAVVTIGSATVPCTTALVLGCVGGAALGAICARRCPP